MAGETEQPDRARVHQGGSATAHPWDRTELEYVTLVLARVDEISRDIASANVEAAKVCTMLDARISRNDARIDRLETGKLDVAMSDERFSKRDSEIAYLKQSLADLKASMKGDIDAIHTTCQKCKDDALANPPLGITLQQLGKSLANLKVVATLVVGILLVGWGFHAWAGTVVKAANEAAAKGSVKSP